MSASASECLDSGAQAHKAHTEQLVEPLPVALQVTYHRQSPHLLPLPPLLVLYCHCSLCYHYLFIFFITAAADDDDDAATYPF